MRKEAQCGQHMRPQQEGNTEKGPEEVHVHTECKHGFALISGTRDDTLRPACYEENCKEDGEKWLRSEGLVAQLNKKPHAAAEGRDIFGNYILGTPKIKQDQSNAEKGLQAAVAEEGNKATERRAVLGNSNLGTPKIERDQGNTEKGLQAAVAEEGNKAAERRPISGSFILGMPEI